MYVLDNCFHQSIQMKGRSNDFSPFDMQLMIDDGDLMQDDKIIITTV